MVERPLRFLSNEAPYWRFLPNGGIFFAIGPPIGVFCQGKA